MGRFITLFTVALACASTAFAQQGGGMMQRNNDAARTIDQSIANYLDGEEIKNLLTPGEFSEWPLSLKAGQVVVAEARSDAFDPALEVADDKGKVVGSNDDRYPGDQRPLLFWRCEKAGSYSLRGRGFHDKFGGQFFVRFKVFDSMDLNSDNVTEKEFDKSNPFLFRIPMKAGQIEQIILENPDPRKYTWASLGQTIFENGLPDIELIRPIFSVFSNAIMAPVDGDYYVVAYPGGDRHVVRAKTKEISAIKLERVGGIYTAKAPINSPTLWSMSVKAGEVIETSTPELYLNSGLVIAEQPDTSKYDLSKPDMNPFVPPSKDKPVERKGPAFFTLPARERDTRITVFVASRDTRLWLASNGSGSGKEFTLSIKPAPKDFAETSALSGQLRIGRTDYWSFDAKAGDVITLNSSANGFAQDLIMRDPEFNESWSAVAAPDQTEMKWNMIAQKPGRYLLAVSCLGDGGGGDYALSRKVFHPKEFGKGTPAQGQMNDGETHVWKFTAKPGEPLLVRWKSSGNYSINVRDESGAVANMPLTTIDGATRYGILKVDRPTTFLLVLISGGGKANYSIELNDLPGYGKGR